MAKNAQIRPMIKSDLAAVTKLSKELGYQTKLEQVQKRFASLAEYSDHAMFVAVRKTVIGWIHVYRVHLLETDGYAEVGGIVVSESVRRQGVGKQLIQQGELWASENNCTELRLRSGLHRESAHLFYLGIGYERSKASYMFRKSLDWLNELDNAPFKNILLQ